MGGGAVMCGSVFENLGAPESGSGAGGPKPCKIDGRAEVSRTFSLSDWDRPPVVPSADPLPPLPDRVAIFSTAPP